MAIIEEQVRTLKTLKIQKESCFVHFLAAFFATAIHKYLYLFIGMSLINEFSLLSAA